MKSEDIDNARSVPVVAYEVECLLETATESFDKEIISIEYIRKI